MSGTWAVGGMNGGGVEAGEQAEVMKIQRETANKIRLGMTRSISLNEKGDFHSRP